MSDDEDANIAEILHKPRESTGKSAVNLSKIENVDSF